MKTLKFKKWAIIWKRDKAILALYGMKKTVLLNAEWQETTGDRDIFDSCMVFERRLDALNWCKGNKDWEIVRVDIVV